MPNYGDIYGGDPYGLDVPDVSALQWPWSQPPPDAAPVLDPNALQPVAAAPAGSPFDTADPARDQVSLDALPPPPAPAPPIDTLPSFGPAPAGSPGAPPMEAQPPLPLPPVDALSGGGDTAGALGIAPTRTPEELPDAAYAAHTATVTPASLFNEEGNATIADPAELQRYLGSLPAEDRAEVAARLDAIKTKHFLAKRLEAVNADWDRQQANFKDRQEAIRTAQAKSDALIADSMALANKKIDPAGGVHGWTRVAMVIGAGVGGAVQAQNGGRNAGMDALNDTINRGIEAQKADMANQHAVLGMRKSALAEEYARTGDMYEAQERVRIAALKHADDLLATEQMSYAQDGTTALRIVNDRAAIAAQIAKATEDHRFKVEDHEMKIRTSAREDRAAAETIRHNQATEYAAQAALKSAAADRKAAADARAADKADTRAAAHEEIVRERAIGGEVTPVLDDKGNVVGQTLGDITMADGKTTFLPRGTKEHVTKLRESHDATVSVISSIDRVRELGPEWLSDTANSDKKQKLDQVIQDAMLEVVRAKKLGVITGDDERYALGVLGTGTKSVTGFRDVMAGLGEARKSFARNHSIELGSAGLDKDWTLPDPLSRAKQPQPGDAELKDAMADPFRTFPSERLAGELGIDRPDSHGVAIIEALRANGGILPSTKITLDAIAVDLQDADPKKREAALAKLSKVSDKAALPGAKAYAQQLLDSLPLTLTPSPEPIR